LNIENNSLKIIKIENKLTNFILIKTQKSIFNCISFDDHVLAFGPEIKLNGVLTESGAVVDWGSFLIRAVLTGKPETANVKTRDFLE